MRAAREGPIKFDELQLALQLRMGIVRISASSRHEAMLGSAWRQDMRAVVAMAFVLVAVVGASAQTGSFEGLMAAIQAGDVEAVRAHAAAGAPLDRRYFVGYCPLHLAASTGNIAVAQALLDAGAKIDGQAKEGRLPLHVAALSGQLGMIRFLVSHGAKVDGVGGYALVYRASGVTPLMEAAIEGRVEAIGLLVAMGANVNAKDSNGDHALNYAAYMGKKAACAALIAAGSSLNENGLSGTAMDLALVHWKKDRELMELLEGAGCLTAAQLKASIVH
jgi:ankyrin repeat protein